MPRTIFLDPEFLLLVGAIHALAGVATYVAVQAAREGSAETELLPELPNPPEFPRPPGPLGNLLPRIRIRQGADSMVEAAA